MTDWSVGNLSLERWVEDLEAVIDNDLCTKATSPANAAALLTARAEIDVTGLLAQVQTLTLVLHARCDAVVPISQGHPARDSHSLSWIRAITSCSRKNRHGPCSARPVLDFMGVTAPANMESSAFAALSPREREILALISEGLGNAEIAEHLSISDKTVRNHVSPIFGKLGVYARPGDCVRPGSRLRWPRTS